MTDQIGAVGTIEATPRGLKLRDADGMWWRLTGDVDPAQFVSDTVRVVGSRRGSALIEIVYCAPVGQ